MATTVFEGNTWGRCYLQIPFFWTRGINYPWTQDVNETYISLSVNISCFCQFNLCVSFKIVVHQTSVHFNARVLDPRLLFFR